MDAIFANVFVGAIPNVLGKKRHDTTGHIAIKIVIGRENGHIILLQFILYLIEYIAHLYSQCLAFFRTGNHTTVIIGKYNDWLAYEIRVKHPLTGTVEVIAISQSKE